MTAAQLYVVELLKLISGAQTGADRAALDWAIFRDIPHGGWCPKGRKAEDGKIPPQYQLNETPSASYLQRTEWNVRDSDGTVIVMVAAELAGGEQTHGGLCQETRQALAAPERARQLRECW